MLDTVEGRIADPDTAPEAREAAERQRDEIQAFLYSGGPRHSDQASKAYDRIRNQLNRLMNRLRAEGESTPAVSAFAEHLEEYLVKPSRRYSGSRRSRVRAGLAQTFTYEPPPGVVWKG